ncbi:MAG: hypothetical protein CMP16_01935 [Rickettsiales bacterium]|nr:hypothetical protein [Rickettsiales bacterium]|tara:strand:- start:2622 stop:5189 length:2568 start_codon:yes stop_codon:yes gene_type:complete
MHNNDTNLLAILGPTNTGKTFIAFDRLLSFKSGIFGFPLRLLARENYDKAVKKLGLNSVALITGEEKILPKEAKYYFCTVESMPTNIEVECAVIDEIQLASDFERGHIFTDRILNFRGSEQTIFLGSLTIESILCKLFPKIKIEKRERFSKLSYLPKQNLSKLKPRSAIIAFNVNKVYEIAELLRTHKGGAALVLGSLSPRTRNAQVEIYEEKKVDFLVATDAIGMGLNLNINHITFSSLQKYDGKYNRNLFPAEIGQIAGRAGRYKNNGTFGYTKEAGFLDPLIIQSIEEHRFDFIQKIYWRNSDLDFSSIESILNSLKKFPVEKIFIQKKNAEDEINFRLLIDDEDIKPFLNNSFNISLLWDVCRIPDFEKIFKDSYINLLKKIYLKLIKNDYSIPENWFKDKIVHLENFEGGIEELSGKISHIRTWTYIANHRQWLNNSSYWQEKTLKIENILSDHLHTRLTNKFVDVSASYFLNAELEGVEPVVEVNNKSIILNGKKYGYINGFNLVFYDFDLSHSLFSLSHVKKSVRNMIEEKISNFLNAPNDSINLGSIENLNLEQEVKIFWGDEQIGILRKGKNIYSPIAESLNSEFLSSENKLLVSAKLQDWIDSKIAFDLKPIKDKLDDNISPQVRAIAFNTFDQLGSLEIGEYAAFIKKIDEKDKLDISKLGIRIGAKFFFTPNFLKKSAMELCALLWKVFNNFSINSSYPLPSNGRVSFNTEVKMPEGYWLAIGYKYLNKFALRIDVFERVFFLARQKIKTGPFLESADMMNPVGCNSDQLKEILVYCGFESIILADGKKLFYFTPKNKSNNISIKNIKKIKIKPDNYKKDKKVVKKKIKTDPNSPFAVLEKLL